MKKTFRVATRPSLLAYSQTLQTVNLLRLKHPEYHFEIIKFSTHGDQQINQPLTSFGGTGVFVKELENALLDARVDFAVHSLKDVPSIQPEGLLLTSYPPREDVRDLVLTKSERPFSELLHDECLIGTGSPRRIVQLMAMNPRAKFVDIRGNIDSRISKLHTENLDAIVLAAAGLNRIGRKIPAYSYLSTDQSIPAIGQGAIVIECREEDHETINMVRSINDPNTEIATTAERSYMLTIGGGCKFPLAAYAHIDNESLLLKVMIGDHYSGKMIHLEGTCAIDIDEARALGKELGRRIQECSQKQGIIIQT